VGLGFALAQRLLLAARCAGRVDHRPRMEQEFLVAFSVLAGAGAEQRPAQTAAHLVDHVMPTLPVRQWVLCVRKRLRWYLEREPQAVSAALHILLRVIDADLRRNAGAGLRYSLPGALSLGHAALMGSSLGCSSRCP